MFPEVRKRLARLRRQVNRIEEVGQTDFSKSLSMGNLSPAERGRAPLLGAVERLGNNNLMIDE